MYKLKLYWAYFKSTLVFNISTSAFLTLILKMVLSLRDKDIPIYILYIYSFMFGGPLFDFFYKMLNRQDEFYFYYNRAITRLGLLISSLIICIGMGTVLLTILNYG